MRSHLRIRAVALLALISASLALASATAAHTHIEVGDYVLSIGWLNEPTFVGQPNGVEVTVEDHDEQPVTDLVEGDLMVVVSTAGQDSPSLPLAPGFNLEAGFGTPGQYDTELVPTTPGEYSFHVTGSIHDQPVDLTVTSGEDTFSPVRTSTDVEFPVKVPTLADVATRLDRIDGRIEALQSDAPGADALVAAEAAADAARTAGATADRALLTGLVVGGAGVVLAVIAIVVVLRAGRRGAGTG
jgi:hypothetical protein